MSKFIILNIFAWILISSYITSGGGDGVADYIVEATNPSEPVTCDADSDGTIVYIDDTDNNSIAEFCFCGQEAGGAYDWNRLDAPGVNCSSF